MLLHMSILAKYNDEEHHFAVMLHVTLFYCKYFHGAMSTKSYAMLRSGCGLLPSSILNGLPPLVGISSSILCHSNILRNDAACYLIARMSPIAWITGLPVQKECVP